MTPFRGSEGDVGALFDGYVWADAYILESLALTGQLLLEGNSMKQDGIVGALRADCAKGCAEGNSLPGITIDSTVTPYEILGKFLGEKGIKA